MTSEATLETRVRNAIARALGLQSTSSLPLLMGVTPGWDSMGHMRVVLEIEQELGITFPTYVLPRLLDVPAILRACTEQTRG